MAEHYWMTQPQREHIYRQDKLLRKTIQNKCDLLLWKLGERVKQSVVSHRGGSQTGPAIERRKSSLSGLKRSNNMNDDGAQKSSATYGGSKR